MKTEYTDAELAELDKAIEAMPGICADGKKGVRAVVEKLVGKPLVAAETPIELRAGQYWLSKSTYLRPILIGWNNGRRVAICINSKQPHDLTVLTSTAWDNEEGIIERLKRDKYSLVGTAEITVKPL